MNVGPLPRLALTVTEAAESLGVSLDYLDAHIRPELKVVRRGRKQLISIRELERWLAANEARVLDEGGA
ncbi:MAG: excisionase family DNA-binding protein [Gaiellaceae bacterium]